MVRVAGVNVPTNKRLVIGLTYIYGIGVSLSKGICKSLNFSEDKKIKDLNEPELAELRKFIGDSFQVEGDLRREVQLNIKKKKDLRSYQGIAHIRAMPVRGQNTKSNAQTAKKRRRQK